MNQRGMSLLEAMIALFLMCSLMFNLAEIFSWQHHAIAVINARVKEIYTVLSIHQEFNHLASELRPYFCGMPGIADYNSNSASYKVGQTTIFKLYQNHDKTYLEVLASMGDLIPIADKNLLNIPNCLEGNYFVTNFKVSFILQAFTCAANRLILLDEIPTSITTPFFIMPIYFKAYVIDKHKLYLHAKGPPQVLFSGFSELGVSLQENAIQLKLQLPHLGTLKWQIKLCL